VISGLVSANGLFRSIGRSGEVKRLGRVGGSSHGGPITSFLNGWIHDCYAIVPVIGVDDVKDRAGGLVSSNQGQILRSYSAGLVSPSGMTMGGFVGVDGLSIPDTANFWDTEASNQASSKAAAGRTTAQMKTQSTYTDSGWNFTDMWSITSGQNNGYPTFARTVGQPLVVTATLKPDIQNMLAKGNLVRTGTSGVTAHGFCLNATGRPGLSDRVVDLGAKADTGLFTATISGLTGASTYYVRAFATNSEGTRFGDEVVVHTYSEIPGNGTELEPFRLSTYDHLRTIGNLAPYGMSAVYRVVSDIDASASKWDNRLGGIYQGFVPMGITSDTSRFFKGKFHGGGHRISHLTQNLYDDLYQRHPSDPFYGKAVVTFINMVDSSGVIDSLTLDDRMASNNMDPGSVFGLTNGIIGLVDNCHVSGSLSATGDDYIVGKLSGLVGFIDKGGVIQNSSFEGTMNGSDDLAGIASSNRGTVRKCWAHGTFKLGLNSEDSQSGGIVGNNQPTGIISECYFNAQWDIKRNKFNDRFSIGGLAGRNQGIIQNSYAKAKATLKPSTDAAPNQLSYFGGLVGENTGTIRTSYALNDSIITGIVAGMDNVAQLVANNTGTVESSYAYSKSALSLCLGAGTCTATTLDSAQMYQSANFPLLRFDSLWAQYNGHTSPMLRAFMEPLTITAKDSTKVYDGNAFSGGNGVSYSIPVIDSLIQGTLIYTGTSQGAVNAGNYGIHAEGGLWSTQHGYLIGYSADMGTLYVSPKTLTITGLSVPTKVYDGILAPVYSGTPELVGKVNSDDVSLTGALGGFYEDSFAGIGKKVYVEGLTLDGTAKGNYQLTTPIILNADVSKKPISITGVTATNKIYDGTTSATLSGGTFEGKLPTDSIVLIEGTGVFATKDAGLGKSITASGYSFNGWAEVNYSLSAQPTGITANITPYPITVTAAAKSIQQGDDNVALTYTADALLGTDVWTGTITRETGNTAGTYAILQGSLSAGSNYEITFHGANYVITEKPVIIDPVVPFAAFTGRANARIFNLQGQQVWEGMLDVNEGNIAMPNIGVGRWVVKLQTGTKVQVLRAPL